jgi:fatty acid desaturase
MVDNNPKHVNLYKRYKFDVSIHKRVLEHTLNSKPNNWHGFVGVLEDWSIIFLFIFFTKYIFYFYPSFLLLIFLYLITICVIGSRQRGLADCLHQASHYCLVTNSSWNFFLGTFCSGYLVFQSFHGYQISHVRQHHSYLGTDEDPDYVCYINRKMFNRTIFSFSL